jgi:uncharacterized membrane protein
VLGVCYTGLQETFLYDSASGAMTDLGSLGVPYLGAVRAIDDQGVVVGMGQEADLDVGGLVYDVDDATATLVPPLGGNQIVFEQIDDGIAVGQSTWAGPRFHAVAYDVDTGVLTDVSEAAGRPEASWAVDVSAQGQVLVNREDGSGPYVYDLDDGAVTDLPDPPGWTCHADAINDIGLAVGTCANDEKLPRAHLWDLTTGTVHHLGSLAEGRGSVAADISNEGAVTGRATLPNGVPHAFAQQVLPQQEPPPAPTTTTSTTSTTTAPPSTAPPAQPQPDPADFYG